MKYMGSKRRLAKHLVPIMTRNRTKDQYFVEPFSGGCNLTEYVYGKRIANDINHYIISLFVALQEGWIPPDNISEDEYKDIKDKKETYEDYLVAFVGICCSFGGKWFGCYARSSIGRNYCQEGKRNIIKQAKYLQDVEFTSGSYSEFEIPDNSIIYCDPPYANTAGYKDSFDHNVFYDWALQKSRYHDIYISEYAMPEEFVPIYSKDISCNIDNANNRYDVKTESLFIVRGSKLDKGRAKQLNLFC